MGRKKGDRNGMTLSLTPEEREEINVERKAAGHDSNRSLCTLSANSRLGVKAHDRAPDTF